MRLLGLMLDDVYDKDKDVDIVYEFLKDNKRELKLVLFNQNVTDEDVAKFVKKHEKKLIHLGTKITRDMTEACYFLISTEDIVHTYFMKFSGTLHKGIQALQELLSTVGHRTKHNR
tara:strand:+ start:1361 stop:1708 length:348 start_codon:yes stop_codon:yes gene_type:complete